MLTNKELVHTRKTDIKCKCGKYFGRKKMGIQCKRCKTLVRVRYKEIK